MWTSHHAPYAIVPLPYHTLNSQDASPDLWSTADLPPCCSTTVIFSCARDWVCNVGRITRR